MGMALLCTIIDFTVSDCLALEDYLMCIYDGRKSSNGGFNQTTANVTTFVILSYPARCLGNSKYIFRKCELQLYTP